MKDTLSYTALYRPSLSPTLFDKAILKGNYIFILFIMLITDVKDEMVIFTKLWESFFAGGGGGVWEYFLQLKGK